MYIVKIKMLVKKIIIFFITYHTQYNTYKIQVQTYFILDIIRGTLYIV
jgi:hypothetical protein